MVLAKGEKKDLSRIVCCLKISPVFELAVWNTSSLVALWPVGYSDLSCFVWVSLALRKTVIFKGGLLFLFFQRSQSAAVMWPTGLSLRTPKDTSATRKIQLTSLWRKRLRLTTGDWMMCDCDSEWGWFKKKDQTKAFTILVSSDVWIGKKKFCWRFPGTLKGGKIPCN